MKENRQRMPGTQNISVEQLCHRLNLSTPPGLEQRLLTGVSTLEAANGDQVAYVTRERYLAAARASKAGLILIPTKLQLDHPAALAVPDVMEAVITVIRLFHPEPVQNGQQIDGTAILGENVELGEDVHIGPHVVIGDNVRIGTGTRIEGLTSIGDGTAIGAGCWFSPQVTILEGTEIGNRVRVHPGAVLGADGFRLEVVAGRLQKIPQIGKVVIEDDVEIGANCTIDRASLTETRIGARTKIDNMVHIGHNVVVGSDCVIVALVGIAGSTRIGRGVMIAGGVGIKDNLVIGDGCRIGGRSVVQNNLPAGSEVLGAPAIPKKDYARFIAFYRRFSQHWEKLKPLLGKAKGD